MLMDDPTLANREKQTRFRERRNQREAWIRDSAAPVRDLLLDYLATLPEKSKSGAINQRKKLLKHHISELDSVLSTIIK